MLLVFALARKMAIALRFALAVGYGFLVRKACVKYTPVVCTKLLFFRDMMFDFRNNLEILRHDTVHISVGQKLYFSRK